MMRSSFYLSTLSKVIHTDDIDYQINFFRQRRLLAYNKDCSTCGREMRQVKRISAPDMYAFRCFTVTCQKYRHYESLRSGSVLENLKISLGKFIQVIYLYSKETPIKRIVEDVGISVSTVWKIRVMLREKIESFLEREPIILGGPGVVVQIDETKLNFNVKSHRGRGPTRPIWGFGIVDTSFRPAKGFMKIVERRDRTTLMEIIQERVRPGSIIHSDEWQAYSNLSEYGYEHETVCHKYNFVAPVTGVHTQHVESYWNRQKLRIKASKGVKKSILSQILSEYMFFDLYKENCCEAILNKLLSI